MRVPKSEKWPHCCGAHRDSGKVKDARRGYDRQLRKRATETVVKEQTDTPAARRRRKDKP